MARLIVSITFLILTVASIGRGTEEITNAGLLSQITYSVFSQMHRLTTQLSFCKIPEDLKQKLADFQPVVGEGLAFAKDPIPGKKEEERRKRHWENVYRALIALYPDFNRLATSGFDFDATDETFETTSLLRGLNEFYGEVAGFRKK